MNLLELARRFRKELEAMKKANQKLVKEVDLSDEELIELIDIYPEWTATTNLAVGDYVKYEDTLYKVIQAHTTQPDWTPDQAPALFNKVVPKGVIPEWVQPVGGHDAYKKGDKVTFEGKTYESMIDANTWSPTAYPQGWSVL